MELPRPFGAKADDHAPLPHVARALHEAIWNSASFSSIATDASGLIQLFNVGAEKMLGYSAAEVTNTLTPADISDPREVVARASALSAELGTTIAPGFEALAWKASRGIQDIYELTYIRKDGSRLPAVVSVTALRDAEEAIIGYLLIGTDNSARVKVEAERTKLQQALRRKNAELEVASRMKSEFLANMSHELRTPLNAIIGFSEVLKDGLLGEMSDQQRGLIGDIWSRGKHLLSVINDILDISMVEAGNMLLDLESVDVRSLLEGSLSVVREKAALRHIELHMDIAGDLGSIDVDARKVKQIVYKLVSNAVKFTPAGGGVTLRVRLVPRARAGSIERGRTGRVIPLQSEPRADDAITDFLEVSVTDSGIGVSAAALARLFQPFSQVDSGLARKFEGTGLGLAMVKLFAQLHGGTVAVQSVLDRGSTFTVWLPRRASRGASAKAAHVLEVQAPSSLITLDIPLPRVARCPSAATILILEDNAGNMKLSILLQSAGARVVSAADAEAGVSLARDRRRPAFFSHILATVATRVGDR